jgi:hypothetical protein
LYYLRINGPATIAQGNNVRLQGVKSAKCAMSHSTRKRRSHHTIAVKPHKLLKSYQYSIRTNSLIGEPYVDIRGSYDPAGAQVAYVPNDPAQPIGGTAATDIADLTQQATDISGDFRVTLQKLNVTIDRINKGVLSYENQVKLTPGAGKCDPPLQ